MARSSASEANGPLRKPLPGVSALPMRISSRGDRTHDPGQRQQHVGGAVAVFSGCWRPMVRGETPTAT